MSLSFNSFYSISKHSVTQHVTWLSLPHLYLLQCQRLNQGLVQTQQIRPQRFLAQPATTSSLIIMLSFCQVHCQSSYRLELLRLKIFLVVGGGRVGSYSVAQASLELNILPQPPKSMSHHTWLSCFFWGKVQYFWLKIGVCEWRKIENEILAPTGLLIYSAHVSL